VGPPINGKLLGNLEDFMKTEAFARSFSVSQDFAIQHGAAGENSVRVRKQTNHELFKRQRRFALSFLRMTAQ
jgi:hypothetical protein